MASSESDGSQAASTRGGSRLGVLVRVLIRVGLCIVVLGAAVGIAGALFSSRPIPPRSPHADAARVVRVVTTAAVALPEVIPGYGTARPLRASDISAEVSARVIERPERIEAGVDVEAGELIVQLDPTVFRERVNAAESRIAGLRAQLIALDVEQESLDEQARLAGEQVALLRDEERRIAEALAQGGANISDLDRVKNSLRGAERDLQTLAERRGLMPSRRDNLEAQLAAERANLELASTDLSRTRVVAPFAGRVQSVEAEVGEVLSPGQMVARLVDLSRIEVPLQVPMSRVRALSGGERASLVNPADRSLSWEGVITRTAPEADAATRTLAVYVVVTQDPRASSGALLRPGQFVTGSVVTLDQRPRIVVPRRSIDEDRVMVVGPDGVLEARDIEIERYLEERLPDLDPDETQWAVVSAGLSAGERVVVSNASSLTPGVTVRPVDVAASGLASDGRSDGGAVGSLGGGS